MTALIVYRFHQGAQERRLLFERVMEALYTVLLDFYRARAILLAVSAPAGGSTTPRRCAASTTLAAPS
jgi:hypothetical protein